MQSSTIITLSCLQHYCLNHTSGDRRMVIWKYSIWNCWKYRICTRIVSYIFCDFKKWIECSEFDSILDLAIFSKKEVLIDWRCNICRLNNYIKRLDANLEHIETSSEISNINSLILQIKSRNSPSLDHFTDHDIHSY
jgi:hypothetical protein